MKPQLFVMLYRQTISLKFLKRTSKDLCYIEHYFKTFLNAFKRQIITYELYHMHHFLKGLWSCQSG